MRLCLLAMMVFLPLAPAAADEGKQDLIDRVEQLERRIAELEQTVKLLQNSRHQLPLTQTEKGLLGTWQTVSEDETRAVVAAVKFKPDGSCDVVYTPRPEGKRVSGSHLDAKYRVIGSQLTITSGTNVAGLIWDRQITMLSDNQLSWQYKADDQVVTIRYLRVK